MNGQRNNTKKSKTKKSRGTLRPNQDILRFAANFTAYVLPPDVVCLYSEDRKFFLQGELYCALAAAIGERGKSASTLVSELGAKFPSDKIEEALKWLSQRGYLGSASQDSAATGAGCWASLGLPVARADT